MNTYVDQHAQHQTMKTTQLRFYPLRMQSKDKRLVAFIPALKRHPVVTYFVLVYALSWACWIPLAIARTSASSVPFLVVATVGISMPGLLGIVLTALVSGKTGLAELFGRLGRVREPLTWYAAALLLVPALQLAAAGIPALLGVATITFAFSSFIVLNSAGSGLLEELGWRGFALPRMQARRPAFTASLLLGVLWGSWHLPLMIARGLPWTAAGLIQFVFFVLLVTAWAVMLTWVYNNTNGSLFLMVLMHTVIDIAALTIQASNWIGGALSLALTWAAVTLVVTRGGAARLSRRSDVTRLSTPANA
jgi:membrane protease YdiL (CAAX protease family)